METIHQLDFHEYCPNPEVQGQDQVNSASNQICYAYSMMYNFSMKKHYFDFLHLLNCYCPQSAEVFPSQESAVE